jgi:hypothetical protein
MAKSKPFTIVAPITAQGAQDIDRMFWELYGGAGSTGATGTGATGAAGTSTGGSTKPGPPGADGEDGADGPPGPTGLIGPTGPTGPTGASGGGGASIGPPGLDGEDIGDSAIMFPPGYAPAAKPINARAYASGNQTAMSAIVLTLSFDTNVFNNGGVHSTSVNPTRFTVPSLGPPGLWMLTATWTINGNLGAASFIMQIFKNGSTQIANKEDDMTPTASMCQQIIAFDTPAAGDYYDFRVFQNTAGNQTVLGGLYQTTASAIRLSD